jgi:hypothetical protein
MAGQVITRIVGGARQAVARGCCRAGRRRLRQLAVRVASAVVVMVPAGAVSAAAAHAAASGPGAFTVGWTRLRLQNGWTTEPFGTSAAAARVISGIVHLKGAIGTTGANPVPFTLPAAFRPAAVVFIPVDLCNATNGRLQVKPNGTVTVQAEGGDFANAACFTSLDGASFAP